MANKLITSIASKTASVEICRDRPTVMIGERINPTGRKKVLAALEAGDFDVVRSDALSQDELPWKPSNLSSGSLVSTSPWGPVMSHLVYQTANS